MHVFWSIYGRIIIIFYFKTLFSIVFSSKNKYPLYILSVGENTL